MRIFSSILLLISLLGSCQNLLAFECKSLLECVDRNDDKRVNEFLASGANPNQTTFNNDTPLTIASRNGNILIVSALLKYGADVNHQNDWGESALHGAAGIGNLAIVNAILSKNPRNIDLKNRDDNTALHSAAYFGSQTVVKRLIQAKANPKIENKFKVTPLMAAIDSRNWKMSTPGFKQASVDFEHRNSEGNTVLCHAFNSYSLEKMELLVALGSKIDGICTTEDRSLLIETVRQWRDSPWFDFLKKHNIDPNKLDKLGKSALHYAIESRKIDRIEKLIVDFKIDQNLFKSPAKPTLHLAADVFYDANNLKKIIDIYYRQLSTNWSQPDADGNSLLHRLLSSGQSDSINYNFLINKVNNIYFDMPNNLGVTPLMIAAQMQLSKPVRDLLARGANPKAKDSQGYSVLQYGAHSKDIYVPIVEYGAEIKLSIEWDRSEGIDPNDSHTLGGVPVVPIVEDVWGHMAKVFITIEPELADLDVEFVFTQKMNVKPGQAPKTYTEIIEHSRATSRDPNFIVDSLLESLDAKMNQNQVSLTANLHIGNKTISAKTKQDAHFMQTKVIVFLPGVLGSEITVKPFDFPAFPAVNPLHWDVFGNLDSLPNGKPMRQPEKIDLFRSVKIEVDVDGRIIWDPNSIARKFTKDHLVYNKIENRSELITPKGHKVFRVNGKVVPYYVTHVWAYDWRRRLEVAVNKLLNHDPARDPNDPVEVPYKNPPSLKRIIDHHRYNKWYGKYVSPRVALAGHSTGGVIMRGLVTQPRVRSLVDKAFFINTPFFGAPKAYYTMLTGDMGVPFVKQDLMREVLVDTPIGYYLAPSNAYPDVVVKFPNLKRSDVPNAGTFMKTLITKAMNLGHYPPTPFIWNNQLDQDAAAYHKVADTTPPMIGYENTIVFWSDNKLNDTPAAVIVNSQRVDYTKTIGDGTVPAVSQKGGFPANRLRKIPTNPSHVPSPNEDYVWETIVKEMWN